jgi:aspartate 1-decarboxylase
MCKGKIHRATVTQTDITYHGSITLDEDLMDAAGMLPYEKVQVYDIDNGARIETYVVPGKRGAGDVCVNGAAARLILKGDKVIVVNFVLMDDKEARDHKPTIILVNDKNRPIKK